MQGRDLLLAAVVVRVVRMIYDMGHWAGVGEDYEDWGVWGMEMAWRFE